METEATDALKHRRMIKYYYNNNHITVLCPGLLGWAGSRRNIHPLTYPDSSSNLYQLLPSTTMHIVIPVQFTCLTIFLHNLSAGRLWSTSWSRALHLVDMSQIIKL